MRHNNILPNNQFNKGSMKYKMWFNQPAKKLKRRQKRASKRSKSFPRPIEKLRPIVRCATVRYNKRERLGRGFTYEEIKEAGLTLKKAVSVGIATDSRRKNRTKEAFVQNVERIKEYMNKIVIHESVEKAKEKDIIQHKGVIMPIKRTPPEIKVIGVAEIASFNV
ncbi:60S ribosomal protein L13 [Dictyocoela muelleri]|nr:60S ribosomal protein L13 [Dictyocoela muelleri]